MTVLKDSNRSIWRGEFRAVTVAAFALVFLAAFEVLAVITVMPGIAVELDGLHLYALAFAGPLATGVIGMVVSGMAGDRRSPVPAGIACLVLFLCGLILAGAAWSMTVMVIARLLQGLGAGGLNVAIYVLIARVYPTALQPRIFAVLSAAWVLPAIVGPFVAGLVAEVFSWRWVFLGVVVLAVAAAAALGPTLHRMSARLAPEQGTTPMGRSRMRLVAAVLTAIAVLGLDLSREVGPPWVALVLAGIALTVAAVAVRPLLPTGTLVARRGIPAAIATKALVGSAFFGSEAYLPYLLGERYGWSQAVSGLALTIGGVSWAGAAFVQGRAGRLADATAMRIGSVLVLCGAILLMITSLTGGPVAPILLGWMLAGTGMGLTYPRVSVLVLSGCDPGAHGFHSTALNIADAAGSAVALAITGILAAWVATGSLFTAVFVMSVCYAAAASLVAGRAKLPA